MLHLSIITSKSCQECQAKTLYSIETKPMPFNIPQQNRFSIIVSIQNPSINITGTSEEKTTTKGNSMFIIHVLFVTFSEWKKKKWTQSRVWLSWLNIDWNELFKTM